MFYCLQQLWVCPAVKCSYNSQHKSHVPVIRDTVLNLVDVWNISTYRLFPKVVAFMTWESLGMCRHLQVWLRCSARISLQLFEE